MSRHKINRITASVNKNIILVSPHDLSEFAESLAEKLQCHGIINKTYIQTVQSGVGIDAGRVDLNDLSQYHKTAVYEQFISPLIDFAYESLDEDQICYIFHLHGYDDQLMGKGCDLIIGAGHNKKEKNNILSAPAAYLDTLVETLNEEGISSRITKNPNLSAIGKHDLNQLFQQYLRPREDVYSVRFGLKRSLVKNNDEIASLLAGAIIKATGASAIQLPVEDKLTVTALVGAVVESEPVSSDVNQAISFIIDTYQTAAQQAMFKVGTYLVKEFFDGDFQLARNPRNIRGNESLNMIRKGLELCMGSPSKTWVYDALKVTLDEKLFVEDQGNDRYRELSVSHKIKLLTVGEDLEKKKELIELCAEGGWSVRQLHAEIRNWKTSNTSPYSMLRAVVTSQEKFKDAVENKTITADLKKLTDKEKKKIADQAQKQTQQIEEQIKELQKLKLQYGKLIN